jgi:hypothetical protein
MSDKTSSKFREREVLKKYLCILKKRKLLKSVLSVCDLKLSEILLRFDVKALDFY